MGGHDHHGGDSSVGIAVALGYICFLFSERILYAIQGEKNEGKKKSKVKRHAVKHNHNHSDMKSGCWLNLVADFMHNVTDGIAGKPFAVGPRLLHKYLLISLNGSWSDVCL